ncbi:nucleotidyltransferase domain-containing protein [Archaeoglobus sp.]|uniref:nucleotidyltransferase domain-containing protein n=1 Tax=Archaeoglobus sp. TaxID=1872626 RepID=UPI0025BC707B|nr:nucleotidyltransferase domain-containing protein [Archaeoglobus sp.]
MSCLEKVREDLRAISDFEAVIFGSYVTGEFREGSDIDVAVITRIRDRKKNVEIQKKLFVLTRPHMI